MQKIILFLKGYLYIKVTGFAPERFVNLCANKGIFLWNILVSDNAYFMNIHLQDFFQISPLVRKTKTKVVLLRRIGLPFLMPQIQKRKPFFFCFLVTIFLWFISSFFIWEIQINGNTKLSKEEITRTLKEAGIATGQRIKGINYEALEKYFRIKYEDIIWIGMKQRGTIIDISIKENTTTQFNEDNKETPCDLISLEDGILHSMIVRQGVPNVSIGDSISKGQTIVSGNISILQDDGRVKTTKKVKADADIWIAYDIPVRLELQKKYIDKAYTGRTQKDFWISLNNNNLLELKCKKDFLCTDSVEYIKDDFKFLLWDLPIAVRSRIYCEYLPVEYEYDFEIASKKLQDDFAYFLANLEEKGVQIISKNVKIEEDYAKWVIIGNISVLAQAFTEVEIEDLYE